MKIGIGTYALFWEFQDVNPRPLGVAGMIDRAAELGCEVFQICDDPRILGEDAAGLRALRSRAEGHGIELELGSRGIDPEHLARFVDMAGALGARTLRSMVQAPEIAGGVEVAARTLRRTLPRLEAAGVTLALETYEQLPTADLLALVEALDSPLVGICLDPANCVSALEHPRQVVESCAPRTADLHVKDFRFTREEGWVGFRYAGAPIGEGLLDLDHELRSVYPPGHRRAEDGAPAAIVEHWLPWQGDLPTTLAAERDWTARTLTALRDWRAAHPA